MIGTSSDLCKMYFVSMDTRIGLAAPNQAYLFVQHVPRRAGRRIREVGFVQAVDAHSLDAGVIFQLPFYCQINLKCAEQRPF